MGSYFLLDDFSHAAIAADEVISIAVIQPADIVSKIRGNEDVKPTITAAMDDHMENQDVHPIVTAAMDDLIEDKEIKPTVTAVTGLDDREGVTTTNEAIQLSRARYANSCTYL